MPNHITNILVGSQELYDFINGGPYKEEDGSDTGDERFMDFNKIIPRPEELDIPSEGNAETVASNMVGAKLDDHPLRAAMQLGNRQKADFNKLSKEQQDLVMKMVENHKKYGHFTWYQWSCANWGTKWNAYDQRMEEDCVIFDTAWSTPAPIWEELAKKFDFKVLYADEDIGSNAGIIKAEGGELEYVDKSYNRPFSYSVKGYAPDEEDCETEEERQECRDTNALIRSLKQLILLKG